MAVKHQTHMFGVPVHDDDDGEAQDAGVVNHTSAPNPTNARIRNSKLVIRSRNFVRYKITFSGTHR